MNKASDLFFANNLGVRLAAAFAPGLKMNNSQSKGKNNFQRWRKRGKEVHKSRK